MHISTAGISTLTGEATANFMNRRSKGLLHLGTKEGGEYSFILAEAVCMVIISRLVGYVSLADAHLIGEDPELVYVVDCLNDEPFADLDDVTLRVGRQNTIPRLPGEDRTDFFILAGNRGARPAFQWSGTITRTDGAIASYGLRTRSDDLSDLLPPACLTFDLRKLASDVEAAAVKHLSQVYR